MFLAVCTKYLVCHQCTGIQLIITLNVLTARGKNIGYLKGSLESRH